MTPTPTPTSPVPPERRDDRAFPVEDTVGAWVPHGRFVRAGSARGPLDGLRVAVKDLFDVAGHPTGAGNPTWLETHAPARADAPLVAALSAAGATLLGKVLTDELAFSLHGANAHYGTPINTRAPERVCGGSSSGSASAVAARLVDVALGTDTGGSTRVPASYCGLWGLRPTHGRLSVDGLVPLCPSFDTPTWLADDASVFGRVADVLLGGGDRDPHASGWTPRRVLRLDDAWSLAEPAFAGPLARAQSVLATLLGAPAAAVRTTADDATLDDWRRAYVTVSSHEAWSVHGRWIERHGPRFGDAIAGRWDAARRIPEADASAACAVLATVRARVRALLGDDGVAVLPSAASVAPRRDDDAPTVDAIRARTQAITCIAGIAGLPQVSVPWPVADGGAPIGVSLLGPAGTDRALVALAARLHAAIG
jgi:amidase